MNKKIFHTLTKEPGLQQKLSEWMHFLEFCSMYLRNNKIKHPVVVELGIGAGKQKKFWEQLFNAEHIGIDIVDKGEPDILGDTHDPKTLEKLKSYLKGIKPRDSISSHSIRGEKLIDILFIDASHIYEDVKKDYELYSPLCNGIVALHGIETYRGTGRKLVRVWEFWDEIKGGAHLAPIITIFQRHRRGAQGGIGIVTKK